MAWRAIPNLNYPAHDNRYVCATCENSVWWDGVFEGRWNSADGTPHLHETIGHEVIQVRGDNARADRR
jgi:hypothetical protein